MPTGDQSIQAVLFDFGGVLLQHFDGIDHTAIEERFGLRPGTLRRCREQDSRYAESRLGCCTHEEWLESVRIALRQAVGRFGDAVFQAFMEADRPLNQDVIRLVDRLRPCYRTGVISNATTGLEKRFGDEFGIAHLFDVVVGSGDIGVTKPEREIYLHTADRLGLPPQVCVFVDDVQRHVDGAIAVGMKGFRFVSYPQLLADLRSLGVRA
ncbi:MAG: HAD family phosphatase [Chloroflexi bacterium]|nr:HAD family phosphatase [Chloroflexota bacterium]